MLAVAWVGVAAWRDRAARMGPGLRLGVLQGFAGSTVPTLVSAGVLSSPGAATMPLFGWSAAAGDLRPAYFLALHAMQVVPLLGWMADRHGWRTAVVPVGAALYALVTLAVFAQALAGLPLIRL